MATFQKLKLVEKLSYGCGDFANNLLYTGINTFLLYFYTDVFGASAAAIGVMLGISRVLDAVVDPVVGVVTDRTHTQWGKFRPYLVWGCVPFAAMGVLLFTTPHLGSAGKLIWAYVTYNGTMIAFSFVSIPYSALLGVISANPVERTKASAWKFGFAYGGVFVVQSSLLFLAKALGGNDAARGWQYSFVVLGLVAIIFFVVTFVGTKERVSPPAGQRTPIWRDLADLFSNRPWLILSAVTLIWVIYAGTRVAVTAYYVKYFVGQQSVRWPWTSDYRLYGFNEIMSAFGAIGTVAAIIGTLFVGWLASIVGKKVAFQMLLLFAIIANAVFYWLRADQLGLMFGLQVVGSVTGAPLCVILWAMYADAADFSEWKTTRRATGLVFAASVMANKFGWAISSVIAGGLLAMCGYKANIVESPRVLHELVLLMSLIPAAIGGVSLLLMCLYPLTEKRLSIIGTELQLRYGALPIGGGTQSLPQKRE